VSYGVRPVPSVIVELERTNDPIEALEWAFDLDGPGGPAAFLLAPSRFAFAERTPDSFALTLHDERWFGAGFGPNPPLRPEWQTCFINYSSQGERLGELVRRDQWDFYTRAIDRQEKGAPVHEVTDTTALTDLLDNHAPHSMVWPGDPEIEAWYGVWDESGLASVAALVRWESGSHVISSVATRTDVRGRGLARHVVTGVVLAASARGHSWLGLGAAHDNVVAKRLYERVGFTCRAEFAVYRSPEVSTPSF
jgi:ribosomal protein S18 acetylase RimI-like enzyme